MIQVDEKIDALKWAYNKLVLSESGTPREVILISDIIADLYRMKSGSLIPITERDTEDDGA